jgi:predicted aconitase
VAVPGHLDRADQTGLAPAPQGGRDTCPIGLLADGGVGLFHIAGVTPEAPDVATAAGGSAAGLETIRLTGPMLRDAYDRLSTADGDTVDAIAIGSPHLSLDEVRELQRLLAARAVRLPFYACTGRHVIRAIDSDGSRAALETQGITFVADTCVVVTPILERATGVLMTNSGKFAHYAPGNTGLAAWYGALADCVESAVAGRLVREDSLWS